ncbi:MAG: universal stress protein [Acidimicrobiia bacterium]|nr:universal stress protein [Acidimicrobiia bacterium]NNC92832.1 universal stress protein [Acidimicrobiia bacterium]
MHIVVATDGSLDPEMTASFVAPHAEGSAVTVLTAVEIPRRLLADLRSVYGEHTSPTVDSDAEYVGISPQQPGVDFDFPGDDRIIDLYLGNQLEERTGALVAALKDSGMAVDVEILEGENGAKLILDYLRAKKADLVVMGTKGRGLFEGMIGSTGTKVARHAPCSVLLLRV